MGSYFKRSMIEGFRTSDKQTKMFARLFGAKKKTPAASTLAIDKDELPSRKHCEIEFELVFNFF